MKTILVATDFSDTSRNASLYAIELAKAADCKIILCHSYHTPISSTEIPVLINYADLELENMDRLIDEKEILNRNNKIEIECITSSGFAVDDIIEIENKYKPDLIIMGMKGAGKLSEFLLGSVSTSLIERTTLPVLVVPEKAKFKNPLRIAFACDYNIEPVGNILNPLKSFAKTFNSSVLIINLLKEKEKVNSSKALQGMLMDNYFKDIDHSYHFPEDDDFVHGLNSFVDSHNANIVAMIPHKHNFISKLFIESHTKKIAFHTHIPLLTIPERVASKWEAKEIHKTKHD